MRYSVTKEEAIKSAQGTMCKLLGRALVLADPFERITTMAAAESARFHLNAIRATKWAR